MEGGRWLSLPPRSPAVARREYVKRPPPPPPPPHTGIYCVCCLLMGEEEVVEGGEALWVGRLGASVRGFLEEGSEWRQLGWLPFLLLLCRWVRGSVCCGVGARRRECKEWRLSSSSSFRPWRRRTAERRRTEDGVGGRQLGV